MNMSSFLGLLVALGAACNPAGARDASGNIESTALRPHTASANATLTEDEKRVYREMAKQSLAYLTTYWQSATGLVNATPDWKHTTMWDVGAQLLAFHSAKQLGLITAADYNARTKKTLTTLERAPLYDKVAYNKLYSTTTGRISSESRPGWSATDVGRLLLALKIIAERDPQFAAQAERIAKRVDFTTLIKDGYLQGRLVGSNGKPWSFQEGRIGYEQYVALGFQKWGADVANALDLMKNAEPVTVMGVSILADKRYQDRLLSEPFVLYGVEIGMPSDYATLASGLLALQEARYKKTGTVTAVSEDAVAVPPDYFYYSCVYCNRKEFIVENASSMKEVAQPRWVSTKAAFGWHALLPSDYTKTMVDYVQPARDATKGWASGVMEGSRESTKTFDVNTASVLLEIAYYQLRGGKPIIQDAPLLP
jgi:hypothetical protein